MARLFNSRFVVCALLGVLTLSADTTAQDTTTSFVYTNDDVLGPNTVSGFVVIAGGALVPIPGSPFSTGGTGTCAGYYAATRIVTVGRFLYASNAGSNDVSGFVINTATGHLIPIPGSPFPTGGTGSSISLAGTPNGAFLMAGHSGSSDITVFSINPWTGALAAVSRSPYPAGGSIDGMKVTPNRKFLSVAFPNSAGVGIFKIAWNGALSPVSGSPFPGITPTGVDINCQSSLVFAGADAVTTTVNVYSLDSGGALTPIPGSPFSPGVGLNSNVAMLDPKETLLFVSNQGSDSITVFNVAANGSLTLVSGSPYKVFGGLTPAGMAITREGTFLFEVNFNSLVGALAVSKTGGLAPVSGSPFLTNNLGMPQSLAVYPPKRCGLDRR